MIQLRQNLLLKRYCQIDSHQIKGPNRLSNFIRALRIHIERDIASIEAKTSKQLVVHRGRKGVSNRVSDQAIQTRLSGNHDKS